MLKLKYQPIDVARVPQQLQPPLQRTIITLPPFANLVFVIANGYGTHSELGDKAVMFEGQARMVSLMLLLSITGTSPLILRHLVISPDI
ncbi:hypothetical protein NEOLEDRAFT_929336 [Neolentinus lepideus HHB14362 ss-1]|uniref:Uncharacterized protein n=1 Tax=Neolentinus lepideus HHB14362 ss-1 TaxID=1314782 RepID=A0A165NL12_9AGAM|nr:hypothetical protein NEOLEDRAFT_929336 [Neolentinus lepideus HHB14362 ss-1]